jgi:hypothetical protein
MGRARKPSRLDGERIRKQMLYCEYPACGVRLFTRQSRKLRRCPAHWPAVAPPTRANSCSRCGLPLAGKVVRGQHGCCYLKAWRTARVVAGLPERGKRRLCGIVATGGVIL